MHDALRFVPLIGLYVRAERPATDEETEVYGTDTMGGEGRVTGVLDVAPGQVELILDGNSPVVVCVDEAWQWKIYSRVPRGQ